jgi:hypothetical protein
MRTLFSVAVISLCLSGDARSQGVNTPETLGAAQELADIVSADTINQLSQALTAQVWPKLQAEFGPKVDPETLKELRAVFESSLSRFMANAMRDTPAIYARHFTAQELRDITAFYRTPSGRKALQQMPKVTAESFAAIMPRMQTFERELQEALQGVLKKRGYPK